MRPGSRVYPLLGLMLVSMLTGLKAPAQQASPIQAGSLTAAEREAMGQIRPESIREVVTALADPGMEGRGAAQPGGERAARFLAERMAKLGLKPLGDQGGFLQRVPMQGYYRLPTSTLTVDGKPFRYEQDFLIDSYHANLSRLKPRMHVEGDLVCVAFGVVAGVRKPDALAGLKLKGKIVVTVGGIPAGLSAVQQDGIDWKRVGHNLMRCGAAGIIHAGYGSGFGPVTLDYAGRRGVALTTLTPPAENGFPPTISVNGDVAETIFAGTGVKREELVAAAEKGEFVSLDLHKRAVMDLRLELDPHPAPAYNVVGLLEGSDPQRSAEAIAYSAHYDAFGKERDGRIFPGAADNALGVGNMLAIAEVLTHSAVKPQRSVIFLATTGEEMGLLGAQYWLSHPGWPLAHIAANLNFDGLGTEVWGQVGAFYPAGIDHSDLAGTLKEVAKGMGKFLMSASSEDEGAYQRGDQYEFARRGIPTVFALGFGGDLLGVLGRIRKFEAEDYHQVGDVMHADWNWDGAKTLAAFYLVVGLRIANADHLPAWLPASPFQRQVRPF